MEANTVKSKTFFVLGAGQYGIILVATLVDESLPEISVISAILFSILYAASTIEEAIDRLAKTIDKE